MRRRRWSMARLRAMVSTQVRGRLAPGRSGRPPRPRRTSAAGRPPPSRDRRASAPATRRSRGRSGRRRRERIVVAGAQARGEPALGAIGSAGGDGRGGVKPDRWRRGRMAMASAGISSMSTATGDERLWRTQTQPPACAATDDGRSVFPTLEDRAHARIHEDQDRGLRRDGR